MGRQAPAARRGAEDEGDLRPGGGDGLPRAHGHREVSLPLGTPVALEVIFEVEA